MAKSNKRLGKDVEQIEIATGDVVKIVSGAPLLIMGRTGKVIGMTARKIKVQYDDGFYDWYKPGQLKVIKKAWDENFQQKK